MVFWSNQFDRLMTSTIWEMGSFKVTYTIKDHCHSIKAVCLTSKDFEFSRSSSYYGSSLFNIKRLWILRHVVIPLENLDSESKYIITFWIELPCGIRSQDFFFNLPSPPIQGTLSWPGFLILTYYRVGILEHNELCMLDVIHSKYY